jgi:hypothetical protein
MAISAATRKVLSPISEKMIMVKESMKEWKGCMTPLASSSGRFEAGVFGFVIASNGSFSDSESGLGCGMLCGVSGRLVGFCQGVSGGCSGSHNSIAHLEAYGTSCTRASLCYQDICLQLLLVMW